MRVWVATIAVGDSKNQPADEIVGVFLTEQAAITAARRLGPNTAAVRDFEIEEATTSAPLVERIEQVAAKFELEAEACAVSARAYTASTGMADLFNHGAQNAFRLAASRTRALLTEPSTPSTRSHADSRPTNERKP